MVRLDFPEGFPPLRYEEDEAEESEVGEDELDNLEAHGLVADALGEVDQDVADDNGEGSDELVVEMLFLE